MEEQRATCHNNMAIYRCTNNQSGFLNVEFELVSGQHEVFGFSNLLTPEGTVTSVVVGSSPVIFNITSSMETFICVTFIILNPVNLIGTTISCTADTLQLNVTSTKGSKLMHSHKHTTYLHYSLNLCFKSPSYIYQKEDFFWHSIIY